MRSGRVDSGKRNKQATIQQVTQTKSETGAMVDTWGTYKTVYVSLLRLDEGHETLYGGQIVSKSQYEAVMPYRAGVTTKMRIVIGTRTFHIDSIDDGDVINDQLILYLTEVT